MALNTVTLLGNIGPNATHPNAITVSAQFIENAINAGGGTSSVKVVVKLINNNDHHERFYTHMNAYLNITVGGRTIRLGHKKVHFDLKGGRTRTIATLQYHSIDHRPGSVAVSMAGSWPNYYSGHNTVSASGTLALNNTPAIPTAPLWPANGNAVGPSGVGTSTYLNWVSMENKSPAGVTQVSPYDAMSLLVSQASYPDHFNPISLASDMGSTAGGSLPLSNYAVETFWYTALGKTLPSQPVFVTNVAANSLLTVNPPANPPATATGWGVAVSRAVGGPADPAQVTVQTAVPLGLGQVWVEPVGGPSTNGGPPPSSSFADTLAWSQNVATAISGPPWPTSMTYPTIGGYWYQFHLIVGNASGHFTSQVPRIYYAPGVAPSLGANGSNQAGEANTDVVYAPMANIAVIGQAYNRLNASASVQPIVAQVIDFATRSTSLTETATPLTLVNYCSDPRAYWLTATAGNTAAEPYVAEQAAAGYTSHNAQLPPTSMLYALQALGLAELDRGHTLTFVAANNNTGAQVSHYVYIGGNPDAPNTAAALAAPATATSVAVSALAWVNSANVAPGRTVTPFSGIRFTALYANGVTAGSNTVPLGAIGVNTLKQLSASWALPANTGSVVAALIANTAAGAAWNGGYQAGDSVTATGFMVLFNAAANTPYFDGGSPNLSTYAIHTSADLATTALSALPNTRDGHAAGVP